jgi:hypothetical protein
MTTYKSYTANFGKIQYTVLVASGKHNYVGVGKKTYLRHPFLKEFENFEMAIQNYKDPKLKLFLELVSLNMVPQDK